MSGNNGAPNGENAYERMVRQVRALSTDPCEFDGEPCYGCRSCFAKETMKALATEKPDNRLAELHEAAAKHNPKPPSPERVAEFRARNSETLKRIGPAKAWENIQKALKPETHPLEYLAEVNEALAKWDDEREPHAKALLQMKLAEYVAGLLEHGEALQASLTHARATACDDCLSATGGVCSKHAGPEHDEDGWPMGGRLPGALTSGPDVRVDLLADGAIARLMVNGYGVASWDARAEVRHTSTTGLEYANECARVLRLALGAEDDVDAEWHREVSFVHGESPGNWTRIGRYDSARRRSLWCRLVGEDEAGNVQAIELCSGREGDDAYVKITPAYPQWEALCDVLLRVEGDCGLKVKDAGDEAP